MTYKPEGYYVIKGRFTWAQLDSILGRSEYGLQRDEVVPTKDDTPCGLSIPEDGLTYQIYSRWVSGVGSCAVHVVLHPDGVCFSGALHVEQDWEFAKELFTKVRARFDEFQPMDSEIHTGR